MSTASAWEIGTKHRVIAAQATIESLPLVTADAALSGFPGVRVVW